MQSSNAESPILVTLFGIVMLVNDEQFLNAESPIVVTLFGIITEILQIIFFTVKYLFNLPLVIKYCKITKKEMQFMGDKFLTSIFPDIPKELLFDGLDIARIEKVKFKRKSNILELTIKLETSVDLTNLAKLEEYIVKKLSLSKLELYIEYVGEQRQAEQIDIENVYKYVMCKHPAIKGLFNKANTNIENDILTIKLAIKSKEILQAKRIDKLIEDIIFANKDITKLQNV